MKNIFIGVVVVFASIQTPRLLQAQGTMAYLSNLGQASAGSVAVGSNSWVSFAFQTGSDASGYALNSVQLAMMDASGNPSGFTVFLYSATAVPGLGYPYIPVSEIGTVNNSLSPTTAGIYTFTAVSNLTLAPNKNYCIVLTGGTGIGDGAYELNYTGATSNMINNDWVGLQTITISTNGLNTHPISSYTLAYDNLAQFAINATVIPEPSLLGLLGLAAR